MLEVRFVDPRDKPNTDDAPVINGEANTFEVSFDAPEDVQEAFGSAPPDEPAPAPPQTVNSN